MVQLYDYVGNKKKENKTFLNVVLWLVERLKGRGDDKL